MDPHAWGNEPVGAAGYRMDPHAWDNGLPRLQRNLDPYQQSGVNNRTGHSSNCDYMRYSVDEPHSSSRVNVGWKEPGPPSHNFHSKGSEVEDPDGEPLEMDEEDPELARKRQKLREIEQQIMHKRVSIALKTVEPIMKNTTSPTGLSCNEQSATSAGATLRDRVNVILQQRKSLGFLAKSSQERRNSSSLRAGGLLLEDHPLKLRVKALMRQRCPDSRKMPGVPPLPPTPSVPSPVQEESSSNKGFQCFLSLLNKGVDMDMLSRIVNDDSEDLPSGEEQLNLQSPVEERNPHLPFRNQKQQLTSDPLSPEKSHCSSRSTSSPAEKEKKEEAAVESKADEQREQLQNILKSLGLSLEVEEMNRLSDRTRERLYGKKQEVSQRADTKEEQQESRPRDSHQRPGRPSASSSCSSYSPSRPTSRSPSRLPHSHEGELSDKKTSPLQQQVSPDHPGYSAYSGYSVAQYSEHTVAYHRDESYYWTQTPLHPSGFPYPHNTYSHFPGPAAPPNTVYPHYRPYKVANLSMDSDLCQSEGQSGSSSGPRCLQVIDTKGSNNQSCLKLFTMSHIRMMKLKSQNRPHRPTPLPKNPNNQRGSQQLTMGRKKKKKKKKKKSQNHPQGSAPLPMNPNPSQSGSSSGPRCLQVADTEEANNQSGSKQPTKQKKKKKVMGNFKSQIQYNLDGAAPLSMNQSGAFSHLRCLLVVAATQQTNDQSDSTQPKKKRKKRKKKKNCSLQPQNLQTAKGKRPRIVKTARDEFSLQRQEDDLHGDLDGELWEKEEPQPTVTKTTETATRRSIRLFMKNKREEERHQQLTAGETGVDVVEAQRSEEEKQKHTDLSEDSMKKLEAPQATKQEEKRPPTEEEMKANLSTKPGVNDVTNQSPAVPEEK